MRRSRTGIWLLLLAATGVVVFVAVGVWVWLVLAEPAPRIPELTSAEDAAASPTPRPEYATEPQRAAVRRAVADTGILALCLERFKRNMGRYPLDIRELTEKPADLRPGERWDGPYVNNPNLLSDPWGQSYRFRAPGLYNAAGYDLWSIGPDAADNTADDLGNW